MTKRIAKNLDELGKATGLSRRQLIRLRHQGMPGETGAYDVDEVEAWRKQQKEASASPQSESAEPGTGKYWRTEKFKYDALSKAFLLKRQRGEFFTRDDVRRLFTERTQYLSSGLLALPRIVAVEYPEIEGLEQYVATRVREILGAYAKDNVIEILEHWRRQEERGIKIVRSRGRPKGS